MNYRTPTKPGEVRTLAQTVYDRYASGVDLYPKKRLAIAPEVLPRKTQPVATVLQRAWRRIDEDRSFFEDSVTALVTGVMEKRVEPYVDRGYGVVITKVGRNATKMAILYQNSTDKQPTLMLGDYRSEEFLETFNGHQFNMTDGRSLMLSDGRMHLVGDSDSADLLIARMSNVAMVLGAENFGVEQPATVNSDLLN